MVPADGVGREPDAVWLGAVRVFVVFSVVFRVEAGLTGEAFLDTDFGVSISWMYAAIAYWLIVVSCYSR